MTAVSTIGKITKSAKSIFNKAKGKVDSKCVQNMKIL